MEQLDRILERLNAQRGPGIQFATFLRDIADNESRWEKYGGSYAGNVVNMQIVAVENSLILLCSRLWDQSRDAESVPNAMQLILELCPAILRRRKAGLDSLIVSSWEEKQHQMLGKILSEYQRLLNCRTKNVLRVMRSENLAHLVAESRDRARLFPDGFENHKVTRYDLYEFSEDSLKLIERMRHLVLGDVSDYNSSRDQFLSYCKSYWENMPCFKDYE